MRRPEPVSGAPRGRFPLVDGLRAIAALSILGYHAAFVLGRLDGDGAGRWLAQLNAGVPLFFAISGFLLYRPWVEARRRGTPAPAAGAYARRRLARIVPAYWVALAVIALALGRDEVWSADGLLTYFGFLQAYRADTITGGIGQAWTLSVEVAFYAVLPGLALAVRRAGGPWLRAEVVLLGGLLGVSLAWKAVVLAVADPRSGAYFPLLLALPAQLDHFVLGMGLAVAAVAGVRAPRRLAGAAWAVALAAFALLGTRWHPGGETGRVLTEHALQGVVAGCLLAPAVLGTGAGGLVRRLAGHPWLAWVGFVSYGVYLWHLDVLRELERAGLPPAGVLAGGLAISLGLGAASWYGIERPAIRAGRRRRR